MPSEIYLLIGGLLLAAMLAAYSLKQVAVALDEYYSHKQCKNFIKDLSTALSKHDITWEHAKQFAETRNLSLKDIRNSLVVLHRDILTGEYPNLDNQIDTVQHMIDMYDNETPFEGLPPAIRIQLERLASILDSAVDGREELDPLVEQLQQYNDENVRAKKRQRLWTKIGFFLTAIGVLLALWSLYYSLGHQI